MRGLLLNEEGAEVEGRSRVRHTRTPNGHHISPPENSLSSPARRRATPLCSSAESIAPLRRSERHKAFRQLFQNWERRSLHLVACPRRNRTAACLSPAIVAQIHS